MLKTLENLDLISCIGLELKNLKQWVAITSTSSNFKGETQSEKFKTSKIHSDLFN